MEPNTLSRVTSHNHVLVTDFTGPYAVPALGWGRQPGRHGKQVHVANRRALTPTQ